MISAALYLSRRSLANATRRRLARLRQPKYLIGFAVGLLYYYLIIAAGGRPAAARGYRDPAARRSRSSGSRRFW